MRGLRLALSGVALMLAQACAGWGSGCEAEPLQEPLAPELVGSRAVELFLPDYRLEELGGELLEQLIDQGQDRLDADVPVVTGSLDPYTVFEVAPGRVSLAVESLLVEPGEGGLSPTIGLTSGQVVMSMEVIEDNLPTRTCDLELFIPERAAGLHLVFRQDDTGAAALVLDGSPRLTGEPIQVQIDPACEIQTGAQVETAVSEAVDQALHEALPGLTDALTGLCGRALGVDLGGAGGLGEDFSFSLLPDGPSTELAAGRTQLGLAGGFESRRAACVPADLAPVPPGQGQAAEFDQLLPRSGEPYRLAVSVSRLFLHQGFWAAHRAGLLCRRSGAGDLEGIDLVDLLPSIRALGVPEAVRAAVWPLGGTSVEFGLPDPEADENLPRLLLVMPDVHLDVFARMDGADLRVLGLSADVTLVLAPRLDGHTLTLGLADVQTSELQIEFAELITEKAGELRAAAAALVFQVGRSLVDGLEPIPLQLPTTAGPEMLEYRVEGEQLLLYF